MAEIGFYHLTRTALPEALAKLLDRTLKAGQRALVLCPDEGRIKALDKALWDLPADGTEAVWLPHGTAADGDADLQPVWLSATADAVNGARYLFLVDGVECSATDAFDRVFDLFDGTDETATEAARARWRVAKAGGHALTYWKQGARGWEKGA